MKFFLRDILKDYMFGLISITILDSIGLLLGLLIFQFTHYFDPRSVVWLACFIIFIPLFSCCTGVIIRHIEVVNLREQTLTTYISVYFALNVLKWSKAEIISPKFQARITTYTKEFER